MPKLRIVDDALWEAVHNKKQAINRNPANSHEDNRLQERKRPRYLLSGLVRCGCCRGGFSMISANHPGCSTARNKGPCANMATIRRLDLETRILDALKQRLMEPQLFALFCEEFTREMNRLRMEGRAQLSSAQNELNRITRELDKRFDLYFTDKLDKESYISRSDRLQERKGALQQLLPLASAPPALLPPNMAHTYLQALAGLYESLIRMLNTPVLRQRLSYIF